MTNLSHMATKQAEYDEAYAAYHEAYVMLQQDKRRFSAGEITADVLAISRRIFEVAHNELVQIEERKGRI